jgi:hypothetical protein
MQQKLDACLTRIARAVLPRRIRKGFYLGLLDRRIEHLPSRRFIHQTLLPLLAAADCANLLFIGIQGYNRQIARTCRSLGLTLWTLDIDPAAVRWGVPGRHIVGDVLDQQIAPGFFDAAIMNGVLGYGVDDPQGAEAAIHALAAVVRPSGFVVIVGTPGAGPIVGTSPVRVNCCSPQALVLYLNRWSSRPTRFNPARIVTISIACVSLPTHRTTRLQSRWSPATSVPTQAGCASIPNHQVAMFQNPAAINRATSIVTAGEPSGDDKTSGGNSSTSA